MIHFLRSDDLKELPIFFYELSYDKISYVNKRFLSYLKSKNRKMDSTTMGIDLFGSDFSLILAR